MGYVLIALGLIVAAMGVVMVVKSGKGEPEIVSTVVAVAQDSGSDEDEKSVNVVNAITENDVKPSTVNVGSDGKADGSERVIASGQEPAEQTSKEKGNAFEEYVADILKGCRIRIRQWNQGTLTTKGAMGENALNPDFYVSQAYGKSEIEYWLECKWRRDINGRFTFPESQIERYRKIERESKRKVFIVFGIGGEPSQPRSVYIMPLDSVKGCIVTSEEMKPYYHSDPASQLVPRISRYFKEEVFKRR